MSQKQHSQLSTSLVTVLKKYESVFERIFFASSAQLIVSREKAQNELIVELDFNFSVDEVFEVFQIYQDNFLIPQKATDSIQHFQNLIRDLENDCIPGAGITEISLYFKETAIHLHSINEIDFVSHLTSILKALIHHYKYFSKSMKCIPSDIHIPVVALNNNTEALITRKCKSSLFSPYLQYWGLYFDGLQKSHIYHVPTNNFVMGQLEYED